MNVPGQILIATGNRGKMREIAAVLADLPVQWLSLADIGPIPQPVEDGETFMANAEKKARHYSRRSGLWTLADDSGLEVDALGGRPGVLSARYAGEPCDDLANNRKLIGELADVPTEKRTARFRCAIALADGAKIIARGEGAIEGRIVDDPRGGNGFGYDPHFLVPQLGRTTAELAPEHKNRISHRGQAVRALREQLANMLLHGGG